MDNKTYLNESARSVSGYFMLTHEANSSLAFKHALKEVILQGSRVDELKRAIFYGKDFNINHKMPDVEALADINALALVDKFNLGRSKGHFNADLVHGVVGVIGEASELVQALTKSVLAEEPIDRVNVIEEAGDLLWYIALILRSVDSTFDEAMDINIAKLRKRFPGQFTQEHALNRDLEGERKILEG